MKLWNSFKIVNLHCDKARKRLILSEVSKELCPLEPLRAVVSKCPAREKEAITGERAAPAHGGGHCLLQGTCVFRHPAEQSLRTLPNQLQESSSLKEGLPTHKTSGEAGLSAAQALLETRCKPSWRLAQHPRSLLEALLLWVPIAQGLQGQDKGNCPRSRFARTQPAMEMPFPWA